MNKPTNISLSQISSHPSWNLDLIKFFLTKKIYDDNNNIKLIEWPLHFIEKIQNSTHFNLYQTYTYEEMIEHSLNCSLLFSNKTQSQTKIIEKIPHNYDYTEINFLEDNCSIMVDASIKKNGNKHFYGIAGCIRNSKGNIVLGFAEELNPPKEISSTTLELLAIQKGVELAQYYQLKKYNILSDCSANVFKIHQLLNSIEPFSEDYTSNQTIYHNILSILKEDQGNVAYIPRNYNDIADNYSKFYLKKLSNHFNSDKSHIINYSKTILAQHNNITSGDIYFHHDKLIDYINTNPFNLEKDYQHYFTYSLNNHGTFDMYIMPIYHPQTKQVFNYLIDYKKQNFELLFSYLDTHFDSLDSIHLNNLSVLVEKYQNKKIAIFSQGGLLVKMNKITPLLTKELPSYQQFFSKIDLVKEIAFFMKEDKMYNQIIQSLKTLYPKNKSGTKFIV